MTTLSGQSPSAPRKDDAKSAGQKSNGTHAGGKNANEKKIGANGADVSRVSSTESAVAVQVAGGGRVRGGSISSDYSMLADLEYLNADNNLLTWIPDSVSAMT